jgi:3-methyladenine DNA glycosylase AlkD
MSTAVSAEQFIAALESYKSADERKKILGSLQEDEYTVVMGIRMGQIFDLAKAFIDMPPDEIEKLLQSPFYEVRVGALSIMGKQAERKKTPESRKKELFDLYLKHTDKMKAWQLVDVSCHKVVGGYLLDKPRDGLYELARSPNWWERRIAVYSTLLFLRDGDLDDAFKISEMLLYDDEHFIHTAVGGVLREAGKQDRQRLLNILDHHAAAMPRIALRFAIEHLDKDQRSHYLSMKKKREQKS